MPTPTCSCQCKKCRAPAAGHCRSHPLCGAPAGAPARTPQRPSAATITETLQRLKAAAGSHSPSVTEIERALPGVVEIDACFLSNPYATDEVMRHFAALDGRRLERLVSHYPSQSGAIASMLAPSAGVPAEQLVVGNGACEVIQGLLARWSGPLLLCLPTFSAYYELASGPLVPHRLDPARDFRVDFEELDALVERYRPDTVVVINPNNPDGGLAGYDDLVAFVERTHGRVRQVIVDESFGAFTSLQQPRTLAPLVAELPHLVVVNSLSKSHGIAGLRLGYAVTAPLRARGMRRASLWNLNAFAEWFCELLADEGYRRAYEGARRRYVRATRKFFAGLGDVPGVRRYPSAANFALLELDRPAAAVAGELLVRHGVYARDCGDKWGLEGGRFLRVAARREQENHRVLGGLRDALAATPRETVPMTPERTEALAR